MNDANRPLTELEQKIKDDVAAHPGLTAEDLAQPHGHTEEVYTAIAFLIFNLHVRVNLQTGAIYPYDH